MIDQLFRFIDPNLKIIVRNIEEKKALIYSIFLARYIVSTNPKVLTYYITNGFISAEDKIIFIVSSDGKVISNTYQSPEYLNLYLNNYNFIDKKLISNSCYNPIWDQYHLLYISISKTPENGSSYSAIGSRTSMEDAHTYVRKDNLKISLVADGHGGSNTSNYIAEALPLRILQNFGKGISGNFTRDNFIKRIILDTFLEIDTLVCSDLNDGSTCIMSLIVDNDFYLINLGDSRGLLIDIDNRKIVLETVDHKPTTDSEYTRIKNAGGEVYMGRVFGSLAVSRAFGDINFKKRDGKYMGFNSPVSSEPDIYKYTLKGSRYVQVIACDGLWDVLNNDQVLQYILDGVDSEQLTNIALERGSRDNISIMISNI